MTHVDIKPYLDEFLDALLHATGVIDSIEDRAREALGEKLVRLIEEVEDHVHWRREMNDREND